MALLYTRTHRECLQLLLQGIDGVLLLGMIKKVFSDMSQVLQNTKFLFPRKISAKISFDPLRLHILSWDQFVVAQI